MANYSNKKSKKGRIVAGVLCGVLCAAAVAGSAASLYSGIKYNGWFSSDETETETEETMDNVVVTETLSNNMKLSCSPVLLASTNSTAESTYTLTATVEPSTATIQDLTWSIAWDTSFSGYSSNTDINGTSWVTSVASTDISDYVTLSDTSGSSITLSCYQPFGNAIIVTCTSDQDSSIYATCQVDYQAYITGVAITDNSSSHTMGVSMIDDSTSSATNDITFTLSASTGTIKPNAKYTYSYTTEVINSSGSVSISGRMNYLYYYYNTYGGNYSPSVEMLGFVNTGNKTVTSSIDINNSITLLSFSKDWTTYIKTSVDNIAAYTGYYFDDYKNEVMYDVYYVLNNSSKIMPEYYVTVSVTDSKTSTTYSDYSYISFPDISNFPVTAVTGVSLSATNVTF